jgi:hypothetical protein
MTWVCVLREGERGFYICTLCRDTVVRVEWVRADPHGRCDLVEENVLSGNFKPGQETAEMELTDSGKYAELGHIRGRHEKGQRWQ